MTDLVPEKIPAEAAGRSRERIGYEPGGSDDFSLLPEEPISSIMEDSIDRLPWEATPPFETEASGGASPWDNCQFVTPSPSSQQRAVQRYLRDVAPRLPDDVREGFVRGAGRFDAPASEDDGLDDLFD